MNRSNPFAARLDSLRARMRRRRVDALLLSDEFNRLALTGVRCDNGVLAVTPAGLVLFTDFRYTVMAGRVAPWLDVRRLWARSAAAGLRAALKGAGVAAPARLGFESGASARWYLELRRAFPRAALVDFEPEVHAVRAVKTPDELERIAAAERLNDRIWGEVRAAIRPGMTEKDVQRRIRALMNRLGDGEAFETIVCAGANGAECHHVPDDTVWRPGEPLLVDMGVRAYGVCSDMTRCVPGARRPGGEYERVYATVLEANLAGIAAARPGVTGAELDRVARDVIRRAGYGRAFGHSLGHGVGYEIHESPAAAPRSDVVLEPGMTVTIEPGVYLPGRFGVRIEDLVAITETGCEVLSSSPKSLTASGRVAVREGRRR